MMMSATNPADFRAAREHVGQKRYMPIGTEVLIRSRLPREALTGRIAASGLVGFRLGVVEQRVESRRHLVREASSARLWRCRFEHTGRSGSSFTLDVMVLLDALSAVGLDWVSTEHRYAGS